MIMWGFLRLKRKFEQVCRMLYIQQFKETNFCNLVEAYKKYK